MTEHTINELNIVLSRLTYIHTKCGTVIETHTFILDMDGFQMASLAWKPGEEP